MLILEATTPKGLVKVGHYHAHSAAVMALQMNNIAKVAALCGSIDGCKFVLVKPRTQLEPVRELASWDFREARTVKAESVALAIRNSTKKKADAPQVDPMAAAMEKVNQKFTDSSKLDL